MDSTAMHRYSRSVRSHTYIDPSDSSRTSNAKCQETCNAKDSTVCSLVRSKSFWKINTPSMAYNSLPGRPIESWKRSLISDIARAKGMTQIAREAGLDRENLSQELSPEGNLELSTVLRIVKSLGLQLHAAVSFR